MHIKFQAPSNQGTQGISGTQPLAWGVLLPLQQVTGLVLKQLVKEQPALTHNLSYRAPFLISSLACSVRTLFK